MNLRNVVMLAAFASCAFVAAQPCDSVDTEYERTYQNHGVMFNVVAYDGVTLDHITANISWGTADFDLYFKTGGFQGHETSQGAWTLLGSASVTSNNTQFTDTVPTVIPIPIAQTMAAGETIAFYLTATPLSKVFLKATTIPWGTYQYTDANIGVSVARSIYGSWATPFSTPQIWNGSVAYCEDISSTIDEAPASLPVSVRMTGEELWVLMNEDASGSIVGAQVQVRDLSGRLLIVERIAGARTRLSLSGLSTGTYVVVVTNTKGLQHTSKVMLR